MNNPRISADWSTTKEIAQFSCTTCVQEVHTKAEVVQLTPGVLGLGVNTQLSRIGNVLRNIWLTLESLHFGVRLIIGSLQIVLRPSRLHNSPVHHVYNKYIQKLRSYNLPLVSQDLWHNSIVTHRKCIAKHMINHTISADWSTTSRLHHSLVHHVYNKYVRKLRWYNLHLVSLDLWQYSIVTHRKCIAKHMINHRISADWCTTKPIAPFSCSPRVQQVHTKVEVVQLTLGLPGFVVLFYNHA